MNDKYLINASKDKYVVVVDRGVNVLSDPGGVPKICDTEKQARMYEKILHKDFKNQHTQVCTIREALVIISNKQAKLLEQWTAPYNQMLKEPDLETRFNIYKHALKAFGPHPLDLDKQLKILLEI